MRKKFLSFGVVAVVLFGLSCASTEDALLESVKFNMDRCNPSDTATATYCTNAATDADSLVARDGSSVEYALLASEAYFAKAKLDLLDLTSEMAGLTDSAVELGDIRTIACVFATIDPNLTDLAASRARLETLQTNMGAAAFAADSNAAFQLALIQSLEAYILPSVKGANPGSTTDCVNTAFDLTDVGELTDDDRAQIQADLLAADNHFINSGLESSHELVTSIRDYWCRLSLQPTGFNIGILKAFTYCQLIPDSETNFGAIIADVDGYTGSEIANGCLAFTEDSLAGFSACSGQDTAE